MIALYVAFEGSTEFRDGCKDFTVNVQEFSACRNLASEILVSQHDGAIDEVSEDSHQLAVVACLEVLPRKVIILGFRSIGSEDISHHILFSRELLKIFMSPYSPAP